jgi:hypothetical protein
MTVEEAKNTKKLTAEGDTLIMTSDIVALKSLIAQVK